jgi:hypothetical protein
MTKTISKTSELDKVIRYVEKKSEVTVHRHYSGRCMFGERCFGFVGYHEDCAPIAQYITRKTGKSFRSDNMGKEMIYYFPSIADPQP